MIRFTWLAVIALLVSISAVPAPADELLPTGTLRVAYIGTNPVQSTTDPKTGELRGPAADLTRELARQLGVPFKLSNAGRGPDVIESVKKGEADIGFVAYDPQRAQDVDYAQGYSLVQNSYIVLQDSPIRSVGDVDRPGIRIGVAARDSGDLFLTRTLKNAELKRMDGNVDAAVTMLRGRDIDAFAANRQRLTEATSRLSDLRVLPDNFYGVEQAIVVAKGNAVLLARINRFLDEARASGVVAEAIKRAGVVGVDVAPPSARR
jgi:polar amino acid transport system substrate-binding protein